MEELADFVERGKATFGTGVAAHGGLAWGERQQDSERLQALKAEKAARLNAGKTRAGLDNELVLKIQSKLKAALYGTDAFTYFSRHDKDESGE